MKCGTLILIGVLGFGAAIQKSHGLVKDNPYQSIIDRNAFNLNPPPPPETNAPPAPPNKILLTGISSMGDKLKVFLEITEPGPGKQPQKPILTVGEKLYGVEVLEIDAEKALVRVKNGPVETTLTFEKDGKTNAPMALAAAPVPGNPMATPFSSVPTRIVSPTGPKPMVQAPGYGQSPPAYPGSGATVPLTTPAYNDPGARTIPSRNMRLDQTRPQSLEESVLKVATATELTADLVKRGEFPPFPSTELTPNPPKVGGADPAAFPQFPTNNSRMIRR